MFFRHPKGEAVQRQIAEELRTRCPDADLWKLGSLAQQAAFLAFCLSGTNFWRRTAEEKDYVASRTESLNRHLSALGGDCVRFTIAHRILAEALMTATAWLLEPGWHEAANPSLLDSPAILDHGGALHLAHELFPRCRHAAPHSVCDAAITAATVLDMLRSGYAARNRDAFMPQVDRLVSTLHALGPKNVADSEAEKILLRALAMSAASLADAEPAGHA